VTVWAVTSTVAARPDTGPDPNRWSRSRDRLDRVGSRLASSARRKQRREAVRAARIRCRPGTALANARTVRRLWYVGGPARGPSGQPRGVACRV